METPLQPVRSYRPDKLKDSRRMLYVVPAFTGRRTMDTKRGLGMRIAFAAARLDETLADGVMIDALDSTPICILAILPVGATRSARTWGHEVHFTRQVLASLGLTDVSIYPVPPVVAPVLTLANPWFGNWGESEGCRSPAAMAAQADYYHQLGWHTLLLDHEDRWSVTGWGLQQVTPEDILTLKKDDEL